MTTRFSQGQTGSLTWSMLNDVMETTEKSKQVIEEHGHTTPPIATKRPRFFLVHAIPSADNPEHYDWVEISIDENNAPIISEEALETAEQNFRSGNEEDETYGISLTTGWVGGYALCKAELKTDGVKTYILCPVADAGLTALEIRNVSDDEYEIGSETVTLYSVRPIFMALEADDTGKPTRITVTYGEDAYALNFAEWGDNLPPTNSGATYKVYPIQPGTRVLARRYTAVVPDQDPLGGTGDDEEEEKTTFDVFFFSLMPRLEVTC